MKKTGILFLLTASLLGCNQEEVPQAQSSYRLAEIPTNSLGTDPKVLKQDELAKIGDWGVEDEFNSTAKGVAIQNVNPSTDAVEVDPSIQPLPGGYVENVISLGMQYLGTPYEFGSDRDTTATFDCSDFTRWVYFKALGIDLPDNSRTQARFIATHSPQKISNIRDAKRGDLLFFMSYKGNDKEIYQNINKASQRITHVGIYLGDGKMLHTMSEDTGGVRIDEIFNKHFEWRFLEGGSVLSQ